MQCTIIYIDWVHCVKPGGGRHLIASTSSRLYEAEIRNDIEFHDTKFQSNVNLLTDMVQEIISYITQVMFKQLHFLLTSNKLAYRNSFHTISMVFILLGTCHNRTKTLYQERRNLIYARTYV